MRKETLQKISTQLINARYPREEAESAMALARFLSEDKPDQPAAFYENEILEFQTAGGIAISTKEAAHCVTDYLRTARFIKGVYFALQKLLKRFSDQHIRVLYAGCGPYATLVLPLLPIFSKHQVELVLLDINAGSLASVRSLMDELHIGQQNIRFVETDATTYEDENRFHLIVTETMFQGLIREPQVAITEHLRSLLVSNGIFIPEEIQIDLACTHMSKESLWSDATTDSSILQAQMQPAIKRLQFGRVFTISSQTDFRTLSNGTFSQIESAYYKIPDDVTSYPDVCIFTQLRIFGTIYLHASESLITNPHCVASLANMEGSSHFQLIYDYRPVPGWKYKLKK